MTGNCRLLSLFLVIITSTSALDCNRVLTCEICAGAVATGNDKCRWCTASSRCALPNAMSCNRTDQIDSAYECPRSPESSFVYSDSFVRSKIMPLIGATFNMNPQLCLTSKVPGAQLYHTYDVRCDNSTANDRCFAYLAVSPEDRAIVVGFRGTQGDWETVEEILSFLKPKRPFIAGGMVFQYFYDAFYLLWNDGLMQDLMQLKAANPGFQVWIVGHSLGGAMASVCSTLIAHLGLWSANDIRMVTFGQPRTGDVTYAMSHDNLLKYTYRIVHKRDLIAHLPPKIDTDPNTLYHHRFEIWYNNDMATNAPFTVCTRADDYSCSNTQLDVIYDDHLHYFNMAISTWGSQGCP